MCNLCTYWQLGSMYFRYHCGLSWLWQMITRVLHFQCSQLIALIRFTNYLYIYLLQIFIVFPRAFLHSEKTWGVTKPIQISICFKVGNTESYAFQKVHHTTNRLLPSLFPSLFLNRLIRKLKFLEWP